MDCRPNSYKFQYEYEQIKRSVEMGNPHVVVVPFPAQGHVIPLMELSRNLAKQGGFRISFVNTDFNHKRIIDSFGNNNQVDDENIDLVSLADGLEEEEDRNNHGRLIESLRVNMRRELKEFIMKKVNNRTEDDDDDKNKIKCVFVLADLLMGWALEVAAELGIRTAAFYPAPVFQLLLNLSIPKFIDDGLIDDQNGTPINKHKTFQVSPTMPAIHPKHISWLTFGDSTKQKIAFDLTKNCVNKGVEMADWVLCNSSMELEPQGFRLAPKVLPIGPLLATNRLGNLSGNFWAEDTTCLQWLDQQPPGSVTYVAFGSLTVFDQIQFRELALGLELSGRPFLWVVRPDLTKGNHGVYPEGFEERVVSQGKMVGWAPQGAVLSHPSVACFLSHCGWNSTMEGVSNGVPFLCWPFFADQFLNETYICDIWKIGLKFERDEKGIITKEEIQAKIQDLIVDKNFKERAIQLKEKVGNSVNEGGSSDKAFKNFSEWLKS